MADSFEETVERFEAAWQCGVRPQIEDFLVPAALGDLTGDERARLLHELIAIDLEFRWRAAARGGPSPLHLEDYVVAFPELGPVESLPLPLVIEEYRGVRRWAGDITHEQVASRFPQHATALNVALVDIDRQLQREIRQPLSTLTGRTSRPPAYDPRAPLSYRDFVLQQHLGTGGMGKVYRALQRSLDKQVAVKMLKKSRQHRPEAVARFLDEARTVARLRHDGIVGVHGLGRTPAGGYFLVMDFIEGENLATLAARRRIEVHEAIQWVAQAANAVEHAHRAGVIHCDLKPANLLLDQRPRIVVTDFGLARSLALGGPEAVELEGTVGFMAPEQIDRQWGAIGPRTDVYGLGAVLYALLAGRPPHAGGTLLQGIAAVLAGVQVTPLDDIRTDVPPRLAMLCNECLSRDPGSRPASAAEVADRLRAI